MGKITRLWLSSKAYLVMCLMVFGALSMQAQTSGQLTNENGEPLIGANVLIQGTSVGTITDIDGKFSIDAKPGDVLVVKYLGYQDQLITVNAGEMVSLQMLPDAQALSEVVVVG